jgi:hypothetical protein
MVVAVVFLVTGLRHQHAIFGLLPCPFRFPSGRCPLPGDAEHYGIFAKKNYKAIPARL